MKQSELLIKGPYTFLCNKDATYFQEKVKRAAFIICADSEGCSEKENLRAAIDLYQNVRRTGFCFLVMLCEYCKKQVICFAIPSDSDSDEEEIEKMMQWLVYMSGNGWYTKWQRNMPNNLWNVQNIIGYRLSRNAFHSGKRRLSGELC